MKTLGLAVVVLAAVACGKPAGPALTTSVKMDSPRAVAEGIVLATKERNAKLAATLLAPEDTLRKHLDCPDDALAKRIAAKRGKLDAEFGQAPADTLVELVKFDKHGTQDQELRKGDSLEGCTTKGIVRWHLSKVELRSTKGDKTDFRDESWLFVKLADEPTWYWLPN